MVRSIRVMTDAPSARDELTVCVYSDDRRVRESVMFALGRRPVPSLPRLSYEQIATGAYLRERVARGGVDLLILDAEAAPVGGMGLARQLRDEVFQCPPIVLLVIRAADAWLATWSRADAVVATPIDPATLTGVVSRLLSGRLAAAGPVTGHDH